MRVGFLVFDKVTQLDLTGPLQVLSQVPGYQCELVSADVEPRATDGPLTLTPTVTFDDAGAFDMVCVPGGYGVAAAMEDGAALAWLQTQALTARWVTSVCTGAFILGAAGLLKGRRATTHWAYHDLLSLFGGRREMKRVVHDGALVTGGGVTAGIDFALEIVAAESGQDIAKTVQLALEYDPDPRHSGDPATADQGVVKALNLDVYDTRRRVMGRAIRTTLSKR